MVSGVDIHSGWFIHSEEIPILVENIDFCVLKYWFFCCFFFHFPELTICEKELNLIVQYYPICLFHFLLIDLDFPRSEKLVDRPERSISEIFLEEFVNPLITV